MAGFPTPYLEEIIDLSLSSGGGKVFAAVTFSDGGTMDAADCMVYPLTPGKRGYESYNNGMVLYGINGDERDIIEDDIADVRAVK